MSQKENKHPFQLRTAHGCIGIGVVNTYSNEIDACKLQNGPDGGRHYIRMQEPGSKKDGSKGSTHLVCPGALTALVGKDIVNYPPKSDTPRDLPAIYYEAENGDIILTAPRGKIKIAAEAIEIIAKGSDGRTGVININADDKILLDAQTIDIQSKVSTKIFSEKTIDMIGKGIMNVYGGLVDFADRTTKGKPSKFPSINEERNK